MCVLLQFSSNLLVLFFFIDVYYHLVGMKEGDILHGYTISTLMDVTHLELVAIQLTHNRTGAKHLHLARDDSNNSFGYV